jgi:hypothetical protein
MVFSKCSLQNFEEKKKTPDLMIMRCGFHFHHHETWFQKKTGLTLTECDVRKGEK